MKKLQPPTAHFIDEEVNANLIEEDDAMVLIVIEPNQKPT
jgi:hypothetical protein